MRKEILKRLLGLCLVIACGGLFISCSENSSIVSEQAPTDSGRAITRAAFHWSCPCGALNGGWQNYCSGCFEPYDPEHGNMIMNFIDIIKQSVTFVSDIPGGAPTNPDKHPIQLPNKMFVLEMPDGWYDTPNVIKICNDYWYKNRLDLRPAEYQDGFALGWYRTVRTLYPQYHQKSQVKYTYDKISIKYNSLIKGVFGSGLKDGTRLAVTTFINR